MLKKSLKNFTAQIENTKAQKSLFFFRDDENRVNSCFLGGNAIFAMVIPAGEPYYTMHCSVAGK